SERSGTAVKTCGRDSTSISFLQPRHPDQHGCERWLGSFSDGSLPGAGVLAVNRLFLLQTLPESLHDIDHFGNFRLRRGAYLFAFSFGFDEFSQILAVGILILCLLETGARRFDQRFGHLQLFVADQVPVWLKFGYVPDFVGVVHRVQHDAPLGRTQNDNVLPSMHRDLSQPSYSLLRRASSSKA